MRRWLVSLDISSPIIVDRFNAIAERHGWHEDVQQPREIPITIVVDGEGTISQIFTTEGNDLVGFDCEKPFRSKFSPPTN